MKPFSIDTYGMLSDCTTVALVTRDGSIDWYCPGRFDAPAVFARLLDADGGHWWIRPVDAAVSERAYLTDTLVLRTIFRTEHGTICLTDALAFAPNARSHEIGKTVPHVLLRRVECLAGTVALAMECAPRLEYGLTTPYETATTTGTRFSAGPTTLHLLTPIPLEHGDSLATASFTLHAGEVADFALVFQAAADAPEIQNQIDVGAELENTAAGWRSLAHEHDTYTGMYSEQVRRSALVLQGLTYQPTGAIVAAATTSLPEVDGGTLNWDYRFAWLRDFSFTMRALWVAACPTEAKRSFDWLVQAISNDLRPEQRIQIVFSVTGERDLTEHTLTHLRGFGDATPVRIGNDAWIQKQLDVIGEVIDAIFLFREYLQPFDQRLSALICALANQAAARWHEPDAGMWEARDRERHYLSSKVMCWVALDRAVQLAPLLGAQVPIDRWERARDDLRQGIEERGWNERVGAYTGAFDSDQLDASVLLMPLVGFLPASDPRMHATIEAIADQLATDGLVRRWADEPNGFVLCSFWLVECLALTGDWQRANALFAHITACANDLGLLAEMVDSHGTLWGNYPQTFSHIGLINAAWRLTQTQPGSTTND